MEKGVRLLSLPMDVIQNILLASDLEEIVNFIQTNKIYAPFMTNVHFWTQYAQKYQCQELTPQLKEDIKIAVIYNIQPLINIFQNCEEYLVYIAYVAISVKNKLLANQILKKVINLFMSRYNITSDELILDNKIKNLALYSSLVKYQFFKIALQLYHINLEDDMLQIFLGQAIKTGNRKVLDLIINEIEPGEFLKNLVDIFYKIKYDPQYRIMLDSLRYIILNYRDKMDVAELHDYISSEFHDFIQEYGIGGNYTVIKQFVKSILDELTTQIENF